MNRKSFLVTALGALTCFGFYKSASAKAVEPIFFKEHTSYLFANLGGKEVCIPVKTKEVACYGIIGLSDNNQKLFKESDYLSQAHNLISLQMMKFIASKEKTHDFIGADFIYKPLGWCETADLSQAGETLGWKVLMKDKTSKRYFTWGNWIELNNSGL